jgi:pilus assembly protein CpaF
MHQGFDPLEYAIKDEAGGVINATKNMQYRPTQTLHELAHQVRTHLRQAHGSIFSVAVIDPKIRQSMEREIMHYVIQNHIEHNDLSQKDLIEWLQQEILHYGPIQKALDDPDVTNIDINNYKEVFIERLGEEEYHPEIQFKDEANLEVIINKMLLNDGKVLTANEPHIDSLFEKYRICAVLGAARGGLSAEGTCVSIRKFSEETITPDDLMKTGTMSQEMDDFFKQVLPCCNVIIAGATNSGKTTTLMAFALYFDSKTRIITIEDSPEMMLKRRQRFHDYHNIVSLQAKDHENKEKRFDISRLTKVSLRMRPVKLLIGEVRDSFACRQAHESMNTGHSTYFTIHASSARNAAVRIVQLAGDGYNDEVIASQLADTVDLIIFQQKLGKSRVITEVVELIGYEGAKKPHCHTLFSFQQATLTKEGYVTGCHLRRQGISHILAEKLAKAMVPENQIMRWASVDNN